MEELVLECCEDTDFSYGEFKFDIWGNLYREVTCNKCGKKYAIEYMETSVCELEDIQV